MGVKFYANRCKKGARHRQCDDFVKGVRCSNTGPARSEMAYSPYLCDSCYSQYVRMRSELYTRDYHEAVD